MAQSASTWRTAALLRRTGRATVGRYLAAYYVGGATAAPLMAASYLRWGWPGVILPLCGTILVVAALAAVRESVRT